MLPVVDLLTGIFLGLSQGTVVASDFNYRITSPGDGQRGSSLGLVDLAKESPVEDRKSVV